MSEKVPILKFFFSNSIVRLRIKFECDLKEALR